MLKHSFCYTIKTLLRDKSEIFWCLCFPMILGTLFSMAFGNLSSAERFSPIPVALVMEETSDSSEAITDQLRIPQWPDASQETTSAPFETVTDQPGTPQWPDADPFETIIDQLGTPGENQLLDVTRTSRKEALAMLEEKKVSGILYYGGGTLSLSVSAEMGADQINQSILENFVRQYHVNSDAISRIATSSPEKLPAVLELLTGDTDFNTQVSYASGSLDESLSYFYNLLAMSCLYSAMPGVGLAVQSQANLSALAARKRLSPVHRLSSLLGELSATILVQFANNLVALLYFIFVLKVNFGNQTGYPLLATLAGCATGVSLGFFVGSIGKTKEDTKISILVAVTMAFCFLSGLMLNNMRLVVDRVFPLFNHVNPAALLSDAFYALCVYPSQERYFQNLSLLLAICILCGGASFFIVRREKYASL